MTDMHDSIDTSRSPRRQPPWFWIALVAGVILVLWIRFAGSGPLEGWGDDLDKALSTARSSGRPIVVLFSSPG